MFETCVDMERSAMPDLTEYERITGKRLQYEAGIKPPWGWDYVFSFKALEADCSKGKQELNESHHSMMPPSCTTSSLASHSAYVETIQNMQPFSPSSAVDCRTGSDPTLAAEMDSRVRQAVNTRINILSRLRSAGFALSQIYVPSQQVILLRFGLHDTVLKLKAEQMGLELQLKKEYGGGYMKFCQENASCFANDDDSVHRRSSYFCPSDRILIILATLHSKESWGCGLNIESLLYKREIEQAFALHSLPEQQRLIGDALRFRLYNPVWTPPFRSLKDYLGARVGLYFVFVSYYAGMLRGIAVFSIPVYILYLCIRNNVVKAGLRWAFGTVLVLWTTWFLERWKRRNAEVNIEWGLSDYHDDAMDTTRPQFQGDDRLGFYCRGGFVPLDDLVSDAAQDLKHAKNHDHSAPVSLEDLPLNPFKDPRKTRNAILLSVAVTAICVLLVGSLLVLLLWYRNDIVDYFEAAVPSAVANAVPGILNAIIISVSDPVWRWISLVLTRKENHRTNQLFENSLILKRFSFQFVSNYSSLLYIAFVKPFMPGAKCRTGYYGNAPDCMVELEVQMMSLVITKATIQQILEVGVPFISTRIKQQLAKWNASPDKSRAHASTADNRYVLESKLVPYDSTVDDYAELVIQFGYLSLFGLAFPPAAVVNLVNNIIEVRTDALKVLVTSQRTNADDAADIGAWYGILEFLGYISVLTNAGLLIFTGNTVQYLFHTNSLVHKVVLFFVLEHVIVFLKGFTAFLVSDTPGHTLRLLARQEFDIARCFNRGWLDKHRGASLLQVRERDVESCKKFVNQFDMVSADDDSSTTDLGKK